MAKQLPLLEEAELTASTPLSEAIEAFKGYMEREGFTLNTRKSFLWDLSLFSRYMGNDRPIGTIGTLDLKGFLDYLLYKRRAPCKPKSYARRLTTLKVFFRWLRKIGAIPEDPAAPIPEGGQPPCFRPGIRLQTSPPLPPSPQHRDQEERVPEPAPR